VSSREEKKDKERDVRIQREADEKKRHAKPYIEPYDEDFLASKSDKKKSSSSKKEEKRERSSARAEVLTDPVPAVPTVPLDRLERQLDPNMEYAATYIANRRAEPSRSKSYIKGSAPPSVPTPPPPSTMFAVPDDDEVYRSSAKPRRGSSDTMRSATRDKAYKKSSKEMLDDRIPEVTMGESPRSRYPASFSQSTTSSPIIGGSSPPRREAPQRTTTMPIDAGYTRPVPGISRAQTFSGYGEGPSPPKDRGRSRSKMHSQIDEEYVSDEEYETSRHRDRKHRSSRKEEPQSEVRRYQYQGPGRATKPMDTHYRPTEVSDYPLYSTSAYSTSPTSRPMAPRESSYSSTGPSYQVHTSKFYAPEDVQYSDHHFTSHYPRDDYGTAY
jgi:hypothetical protein